MKHKDPSQQLLKAYQAILEGFITYAGETITVGTRIPRKKMRYVHIYIDAMVPYNTGDKVLFSATVALQTVTMQDVSEGDETAANSIQDQVLQLVTEDPEDIVMTDFTCLTAQFEGSEHDTEMTETNYTITRKLRINHFIEQTT